MARPLTLTDPVATPIANPGILRRAALRLIRDPRDLTFITHMIVMSLLVIPGAVAMFIAELYGQFAWWMPVVYLGVILLDLLPRFMLMQHNTAHRKLFIKPLDFLNNYIPWVLGLFFGQTPNTYFSHHIGMHHPENNLEEDDSSTMPYQRDSFFHFLHYYGSFIITGIFALVSYLTRKNRYRLAREAAIGELFFIAMCVGLMFVAPWSTLFVFVIPLFLVRFLMMAGNWGQHAFIDRDEPGNCYRNSITCINCRYNKVAFNDGYHISHHLKATRHWTEHPQELLDNLDTYVKEDAIIFRGIDFFMVWAFLMLKRYNWLAARYVQIGDEDKSREEIIAMLRERTRKIKPVAAASPDPVDPAGQAAA